SRLRFKYADVWYTLLLVGCAAALASLFAAMLAIRLMWATTPPDFGATIPAGYSVLLIAAPLVSAVLAPLLWWRMIVRPGRLSVRRGIAVGALAAIIAHPVIWYVALVLAFLAGQRTVAGMLVNKPLQDVIAAVFLGAVSLIYTGWLTALVGGAIGGMIALLQSVSGCRERWRAALSR
ncbi:MAG: hypothetical protein ACM3N4_01560, partial [Nitrososphaerota archaeon]